MVKAGFYSLGILGHSASVWPLGSDGDWTKVSHMGDLFIGEWPPLDTKAWLSIPGNTSYVLSHIVVKRIKSCPYEPTERGDLTLNISWTPPYVSSSFAYFYLYPFSTISHNMEHNSFSELCSPFWQITKTEDDLRTPDTFKNIYLISTVCLTQS